MKRWEPNALVKRLRAANALHRKNLSRSSHFARAAIAKTSPNTQAAFATGKIFESHARLLYTVKDFTQQDHLLMECITKRLTVRALQKLIDKEPL